MERESPSINPELKTKEQFERQVQDYLKSAYRNAKFSQSMYSLPKYLIKVLKEHKGGHDTSQIELYPKPGDNNIDYAVVNVCKNQEELNYHIYKIINGIHAENMEIIKIGEVILANNSYPIVAYHQKLHPTN